MAGKKQNRFERNHPSVEFDPTLLVTAGLDEPNSVLAEPKKESVAPSSVKEKNTSKITQKRMPGEYFLAEANPQRTGKTRSIYMYDDVVEALDKLVAKRGDIKSRSNALDLLLCSILFKE